MQKSKIKYIIVDENTLCYVFEENPDQALILAASLVRAKTLGRATRSSPYNENTSGPLTISELAIPPRMATLTDFDVFGHGAPGFYGNHYLKPILAKSETIDEEYDPTNW